MAIRALHALSLNETGRRHENQDSIFPENISGAPQGCFIVCDGVGGAPGGAIASKAVAHTVGQYLGSITSSISERHIDEAIHAAEDVMHKIALNNPLLIEMCTTIVVAILSADYIHFAWAGDSRAYMIRNGDILFKSRDHSLLQERLDAGLLKEDEVEDFPWKNVVTRVVGPGQPHANLEHYKHFDVCNDDLLLLCSDGVLEGVPETRLLQLLAKTDTLESKCKAVAEQCEQHSKDNYSLIMMTLQSY
jgi:protein phosphatase